MEDEEKVLRWKWEFMRRNSEYREDYKKLQKRKKEKIYEQEEMKYSKKWSSGWLGKMYDPDLSFEEILDSKASEENIVGYCKNILSQWAFVKGLGSGAVREIQYMMLPDGRFGFTNCSDIEPGDYFLKINFDKVNSVNAVKKMVCSMIDSQYAFQKSAKQFTHTRRDDGTIQLHAGKNKVHTKKGQKYEIDYDLVLKVGMLKEEGKTNAEIARKLRPRAFKDSDDNPANPESAIRQVSNYYKSYKEYVNGGYKKISVT